MRQIKIIIILMVMLFTSACLGGRKTCPPNTSFDPQYKVCVQDANQMSELDMMCASIGDVKNSLDEAVEIAINCVKADPARFDKAFNDLRELAKMKANIENGKKLLKFVDAVSLDSAYVSRRKATATWNRYFSPGAFVSFENNFDKVADSCNKKDKVIQNIRDELIVKIDTFKTCLNEPGSESDIKRLIETAERRSEDYIVIIKATCSASSGYGGF